MRRRTWAGLLALALVALMSAQALREPVPYVTFSPGPTVNVLGKSAKSDIITVSGHKSYRGKGGLRLLTVIPSGPDEKVSIPLLVGAWLDPDRAVYPREAIYPKTATQKSVREESNQQMTSSKDLAVAAALGALDIPFKTGVQVAQVEKGGPADGKLKRGDVLVAVDGKLVRSLEQLTGIIRPKPVGSEVRVKVKRNAKVVEKLLTTTTSTADPKDSAVRIAIAPCCYDFPFEVKLNLDKNIGGPSGGLMFAMGIYDLLTPGSLTGGKVIAGTGEIDAQGKVGEIGGIQQKLVGAQHDGAQLFLVPAANCAEALDGHYDPDKMRLVEVTTLEEGISDVKAWVKDPDAKLARCTK
ncbi:MAG: PDZ domain-containing protein [Marmoricola sp.]